MPARWAALVRPRSSPKSEGCQSWMLATADSYSRWMFSTVLRPSRSSPRISSRISSKLPVMRPRLLSRRASFSPISCPLRPDQQEAAVGQVAGSRRAPRLGSGCGRKHHRSCRRRRAQCRSADRTAKRVLTGLSLASHSPRVAVGRGYTGGEGVAVPVRSRRIGDGGGGGRPRGHARFPSCGIQSHWRGARGRRGRDPGRGLHRSSSGTVPWRNGDRRRFCIFLSCGAGREGAWGSIRCA